MDDDASSAKTKEIEKETLAASDKSETLALLQRLPAGKVSEGDNISFVPCRQLHCSSHRVRILCLRDMSVLNKLV